MSWSDGDADRAEIRFVYDEDGRVYTNTILWSGEKIQVISNSENGTTRELQRADEIVQALIKARKR